MGHYVSVNSAIQIQQAKGYDKKKKNTYIHKSTKCFDNLSGVLAAVGASNLQFVDLNSSRNLVVFGVSLFLGLSFPSWLVNNAELIQTGKELRLIRRFTTLKR